MRIPTICHLLHSLRVGGAEVLAARLARRFVGAYRFVFACLDDLGSLGQELRDQGFPVHVLGRWPGLDWRCTYRLASLLRREGVDLLHAHQYTPFFYGSAARQFRRRPTVLFTEHGRHHPDYPRRKRMLANRLLLSRRDRVVGVGRSVRQALIDNEGIRPERIEVIYNGIDLSPVPQGGDHRTAVRREIQVGDRDLVVIQVARLDYLKDHLTAIRALECVVRQRADVRLILVGEGPEEGAIRELVAACRLGDHVRFLGLRGDVARLLAAADLFLLSSISEGIPLTLIEAMAAGLPIVATRVGGVPEVVEDGRTGLLTPGGNPQALAESILRLADQPLLRGEMGRLGRARAESLFSEGRMHAAYHQLYQTMLRQG
jgi:L-malate glycosyltransferase